MLTPQYPEGDLIGKKGLHGDNQVKARSLQQAPFPHEQGCHERGLGTDPPQRNDGKTWKAAV